ncbi:class I SAM-dependent methyltransferase [Pseudoduganella sp. OTU4001]|uniref:class I SAM-dependent methyltransferase n=1 Tax=Pseudoduganella sp. OTU4001 TaxID=3043854 RepID=UPI00313C941C
MGWTGGYTSDIEYTAGYYPEQNPVLLNFVATVNGYEPHPLDKPFTYFELGFGRGETVNLLAASNPQGRFYAADFNPAHVAGATALANAAGLENLTLLESSFADLAAGAVELPQFDFITLHGIYTWVTAENRRCIVDFVARYLKPGGFVYVSYNAMPGWTVSLPLQRLLVEYGDAFPNRSDIQVGNAVEFVQKMVDAKASYFGTGGPMLQVRLDAFAKYNRSYLVHEYMHKHWQPLYHADVARDFTDAKLDFVGTAELPEAYPKLYLSEEKQQLIATFPDSAMQETIKDYCQNTCFRKDIYIRGARKLEPLRRRQLLERTGLALCVTRDDVKVSMSFGIGEVTVKSELCLPICDALARKPHTLAQLAELPALQGRNFEDVVQLAALLVASKQAVLFNLDGAEQDAAQAKRMNLALAAKARYGDEFNNLCSSLTGGALGTDFIARLVYWLIAGEKIEVDEKALGKAGWVLMKAQGRHMVKEGVHLSDDASNIAELTTQIGTVLREKLPVWRHLNML